MRSVSSLIGAEKPRLIDSTGRSAMPVKSNAVRRLVEHQHAVLDRRRPAHSGRSRPSLPTRPMPSGITIGCLSGWPGVGGTRLRAFERVGLARRIVAAATVTCGVPAWLYQRMNCVRSRPLASAKHWMNCSTVAASPSWRCEIEVHAGAEFFRADQRLHHAHDFGAFFVDGRGVEIVDLLVGLRPHRMRQRPGILDELRGAQAAHVGDALDRARAHVGGKFLVAENGEAFLQAKLEPVAAGDAVAGPVVEIFVRDHRLDAGEIGVGRGLGASPARICR